MKKATILLLLVFCFFLRTNLRASDTLISFESGILEPWDIHFINNNTGYIGANSGLHISTNAGENWSYHYGPKNWGVDTTMGIYDFDFSNATAYAVGWRGIRINDSLWQFYGLIIKSIDNGAHWFDISIREAERTSIDDWLKQGRLRRSSSIIQAVLCINPNEVIISGDGAAGQYQKTTDGGLSWVSYTTGWNTFFELVSYNEGLLGGQGNRLSRSTNGGTNWVTISVPQLNTSTEALASVGSTIFVGGWEMSNWTYLSCSYSTNTGLSWVNVVLPDTGSFNDILFLDNNIGYATARYAMSLEGFSYPKGYIYKTVDQGRSWEKIFEQQWQEMFGVCETPNYIYFVGMSVVKRLQLNMVGAHSQETTVSNYLLSQNYPNPFNPTTKISYSVPVSDIVSLTIFDVTGKKLQTLINEQKSSGNYEVEFDASNLSSGTYYYKISAGEFTETKRMVLIK